MTEPFGVGTAQDVSSMADAARRYAENGLRVFPCRGKTPLTPNGFHDATTDPEQLAAWWREHPYANIAGVPGPHFIVIDIDSPEAKAEAEALGLYAQPGPWVQTARGEHLWFKHPDGAPIGNAGLGRLHVRADAGYVMLPRSVHPDGPVYAWGNGSRLADAPALPPHALAALTDGDQAPRSRAPELSEIISEGARNQTLASLAGTMRKRGMTGRGILEALRAENTARCKPPLDDAEVERIAASVSRYPPAEAGAPRDAEATKLTAPRSLADILSNPESAKPPAVVVPGLAWAGRITLVSAREGVGKSTLFTAAAAAVTTGGEFLGEHCGRGPVLWVLVEEHINDVVIRAVRFQTAPDTFHVLERPELPLASLTAAVKDLKPALVIIDTLHRFASLTGAMTDAHAADSWGPLMTALDRLARTSDAAILMSAQAAKSTGEYRDSTEIGHGVDVVLNLVRPEKTSAVRRLEKQKARWALDDTVTFELAGDAYRRGGAVAKKLTPKRRKVLDALEPPMTFGEWMEAAAVPATTFERAVKYLVSQGYVTKIDDSYNLPTPATPNSPPMGVMGVERELPPFRVCPVGTHDGGNAGGENWGRTVHSGAYPQDGAGRQEGQEPPRPVSNPAQARRIEAHLREAIHGRPDLDRRGLLETVPITDQRAAGPILDRLLAELRPDGRPEPGERASRRVLRRRS